MNGYPEYQVNNFGKIRSLKNNKIKEIKQTDNNYGYLCATLCSNGKLKTEREHYFIVQTKNDYKAISHSLELTKFYPVKEEIIQEIKELIKDKEDIKE